MEISKRVVSFLLAFTLVSSVSASGVAYTVTKTCAGTSINGENTAQPNQNYHFSVELPEGAGISIGYADIYGTAAINRNTGEGRSKSTVFLPEMIDTTSTPAIAMQADNDSPMRNMSPYKRVITDTLNAGTSTTYCNLGIANQLSSKPSTVSFGFWINEGDVNRVFGTNPFTFWTIYKGGNSVVVDIPLKSLIDSAGIARTITPYGTGMSNLITSCGVTAACLQRDNGWAYIVCNMENIVYAASFTSTSTLFYILFNNVSAALRTSGAKIELSNFTYLTNAKIESGYIIYPDSAANASFRYVLDKNVNEFTLPAGIVTGNLDIHVYATLRQGDSSIVAATSAYDKNVLVHSNPITVTINPNGNNILSVLCDEMPLTQGFDYTTDGNAYTLSKAYLSQLSNGIHTLRFATDFGISPEALFHVVNTSEGRLVVCAVNGTNVAVRTSFNTVKDLVQQFTGLESQGLDVNNPINFSTASLIDKSQQNIFQTGTLLAYGSDEAAPFNFNNSYIGANHGQSNGLLVTAKNHGKTYADIGSLWADQSGTKWNLLKIVNVDQLLFLSENIAASPTKYAFKSAIAGNLHYVSHGVHTGDVVVEGYTNGQQVCTAIRHTQKEVYAVVDGLHYQMGNGDIANCDYVDIMEKYDIINPATIGDAIRAGRPQGGYSEPQSMNVGSTIVSFNMIYRIASDGTVLSIFDHTIKSDVNFNYYGAIQYMLRNDTYVGGVYRYIPKTKPFTVDGTSYNFTQPYNVTANAVPNFTLTADYWTDPNFPPDREVDYMRNAQGSNVVGFAGGYLPILDGAPAVRKSKTSAWGFLYPSKKTYPYFVTASAFPNGTANQSISGVAYKKFQNMEAGESQIGTIYTIPYEQNHYLYIDYHTSGSDHIYLPESLKNKYISLVEKSNNVTCTVGLEQIDVTVTGESTYGYLVLKASGFPVDIQSGVVDRAGKTVKAVIENNTVNGKPCIAIAAAYKAGHMTEIKTAMLNLTGLAQKEQLFEMKTDDYDVLKIFVWERLDTLRTLCGSYKKVLIE